MNTGQSTRDLLAEELENNACPVCGEVGPCGFTTDGEPLICLLASESLNTGEPTPAGPGVANEGDA